MRYTASQYQQFRIKRSWCPGLGYFNEVPIILWFQGPLRALGPLGSSPVCSGVNPALSINQSEKSQPVSTNQVYIQSVSNSQETHAIRINQRDNKANQCRPVRYRANHIKQTGNRSKSFSQRNNIRHVTAHPQVWPRYLLAKEVAHSPASSTSTSSSTHLSLTYRVVSVATLLLDLANFKVRKR